LHILVGMKTLLLAVVLALSRKRYEEGEPA
jgi:hypothetical protein